MIKSFRNRGLQQFFETGNTRRLPVQNTNRVRVILTALHAATKPSDMDLPGLRFHSLAPGMPGRFALFVTGNYRITFAFNEGATDVDLEDYH